MPSKKPNKYVFTVRVWKRRDRGGAWCCTIKQAGCKTITKVTDGQHRGSAEEWAMAYLKQHFKASNTTEKAPPAKQLELAIAPAQGPNTQLASSDA